LAGAGCCRAGCCSAPSLQVAAVEALLRLACALFVRLVGVWPVRVAIAPARASCELAGKRAGGVCGECAGRPFTIDVGSGDFAEAEHDETREEPDEVDAEEDAEAVAVEAAAAAAPVGTGRVGLLSATGEVVIGGGEVTIGGASPEEVVIVDNSVNQTQQVKVDKEEAVGGCTC